jgi:CRISPR system Cascade subunit CasD
MAPVLIDAANAGEAMKTVFSGEHNYIPGLRRNKNIRVFWSAGDDTGIQPKQSVRRRDEPFSRKPWQFTERIEEMGYLKKEDEDVL